MALIGSYCGPESEGIHVVTIDESGASLERRGGIGGIANPSFLAIHPDGLYAYAVSEVGVETDGSAGGAYSFRIDRTLGEIDLVPLNRRSTDGDHPCHLSIHASGRWLVATNYSTGDVVVLPIADDGTLGEQVTRVRHVGSSVDVNRQQSPHPHASLFSPDGRFLIVADLGIDHLVVYAFDDRSGGLSHHGEFRAVAGSGPRHLAFHPAGDFLFVVNELDSTVSVLRWVPDGTMQQIQTVSTLPEGEHVVNLAADLHVDEGGGPVHVSNRGHDSITTFAFGSVGGLVPVANRSSGGAWPRGFGVTPGVGLLVVANERSDEVRLVGTDESVHGRIEVGQPTCVVFVPKIVE